MYQIHLGLSHCHPAEQLRPQLFYIKSGFDKNIYHKETHTLQRDIIMRN